MIKFINSHQQALEDHGNVYKNASASEIMQNTKCTMHMHNATTKPRDQREANKAYKANQKKVSDQKG